MMIKANGCELEFNENSDLYIGIPGDGQTFMKRTDLSPDTLVKLEQIQLRAKELIQQTHKLISA